MKAITIYQPWASLIACGAKKFETRPWATKYRGPIAIHAGMKDPCKMPLLGLEDFENAVRDVFDAVGLGWCVLPRGMVIATAELVECWSIVSHPGADTDQARRITVGGELDVPKHHPRFHDVIIPSKAEILFGDWRPGRYAWELANVQEITPIPARGRQGLWNWETTA